MAEEAAQTKEECEGDLCDGRLQSTSNRRHDGRDGPPPDPGSAGTWRPHERTARW